MIPLTDSTLFDAALDALAQHRRHVGRSFKGRFTQIFYGLKFYQNQLPSMYSQAYVTTDVLQNMLDDLYTKVSRPLEECVLSLFERSFLARTGVTPRNRAGPQNTWRNNFNLQKGIGCYAPPADLSSSTFLNESRLNCRYLQPASEGNLRDARCSLHAAGAKYRHEANRKWLRIGPNGEGYAVVDLQNISNFIDYLAPNGHRVPVVPLIVALYHDADTSLPSFRRREIDLPDFMADFNFSYDEFAAYFEDDRQHPLNHGILNAFQISYTRARETSQYRRADELRRRQRLGAAERPARDPVLSGTTAPPPRTNTGWHAEQYAYSALETAGWKVYDVSRQQLGYDLLAKRSRKIIHVEVKSSLGSCSPIFTAREWQQARRLRGRYVAAVIENFKPLDENVIYWIPDPASSCFCSTRTTIEHLIPRTEWVHATIQLSEL